ncbi:hypothetical protein AOL_s00043g166 [Orbilia oligospora ATCC 24927]|uniref:Peptidase S8/S53 domain-containing protein n=1 Tax=Arthrobotrys oligospora (strain ATCC 24927 / CBS 115.81 / DSM 1491) TaxID=756982 RepID=G1X393_ARTOA|nr:hypothetical protein AOL_s00043g166 [Orbilia oligospora ATCC 24927]EGX52377.1 hypothetical protein AOL_s00043g166 [Orbilia oligospora ATCC 24927]
MDIEFKKKSAYRKRGAKNSGENEEPQNEQTKTMQNFQKNFLDLLFNVSGKPADQPLRFLKKKVEEHNEFLETCTGGRNILDKLLGQLVNSYEELPEDILLVIFSSIEYMAVKKPGLLHGKDVRETTALNIIAKCYPDVCMNIVNILIPPNTLDKAKLERNCRGGSDDKYICPLSTINEYLREHSYRKDIAPEHPVSKKYKCFHDLIDLEILEDKNTELKCALESAILPKETTSLGSSTPEHGQGKSILGNLLNEDFIDPINDPDAIEDQLSGFESFLNLCKNEVFSYRNEHGLTPLQQAICFYRDSGKKSINWSFLYEIIKSLVVRFPESIYIESTARATAYTLLGRFESSKDRSSDQTLIKTYTRNPNEQVNPEADNDEMKPQRRGERKLTLLESKKRTEYLLKMNCIRDGSKSHNEKIRYLYSNNGPVRNAPAMEFEEILELVRLPQKWQPKSPTGEMPKVDGLRFSDEDRESRHQDPYTAIFRWLRNDKKVKKIVRVEVDEIVEGVHDHNVSPHSNHAIRQCLQGFDVEELDWRKFDICGNTIFEAVAPKISQSNSSPGREPALRILDLYSSGNTAVLRGWANDDSLSKLKNLKEITIHIRASNRRDRADCEAYKETLKTKLEQFHPSLTVRFDEKMFSSAITDQARGSHGAKTVSLSESKTQWIDKMENFRNCIQRAIDPDRSQPILKNFPTIKVAVLDDGVNFETVPPICIKDAKAFCHKGHLYYRFDNNHGTITASLVREVCPDVELYIARLDDTKELSRDRFHIRSAAEGIQSAIDKKVDIISMSWSFAASPNDEDKNKVREAIQLAASKKILLFASMPDKGPDAKLEDYWPAGLPDVIRIGSATTTGQRSTDNWSSEPEYIFPGEDIELRSEKGENDKKVVSGSSASTALAAGLAALILFYMEAYVQVKSMTAEEAGDIVGKVRTCAGMRASFRALSSKHPTWNDYYVRPYMNKTFNKSVGDRSSSIKGMITDVGTVLADRLQSVIL